MELTHALSAAWLAFARHGDPNNPRTPRWPAYALPTRSTLILDERLRIENDPDADLRVLWEALPAPAGVFG